jgi:hypothetical protein
MQIFSDNGQAQWNFITHDFLPANTYVLVEYENTVSV